MPGHARLLRPGVRPGERLTACSHAPPRVVQALGRHLTVARAPGSRPMNHYYSDSLLSAYLESTENFKAPLVAENRLDVPTWAIDELETPTLPTTSDPTTPYVGGMGLGHTTPLVGSTADPASGLLTADFSDVSRTQASDILSPGRGKNRYSVHSGASHLSAVSAQSAEMSAILSLDSVAEVQRVTPTRTKSRLGRFRNLFGGDGNARSDEVATDATDSVAAACTRIEGYFAEPSIVPWVEVAETFLFGDTLDALFPGSDLTLYVCHSAHELGELRFSNLTLFHTSLIPDPQRLLQEVAPHVVAFDEVLDLYAQERTNRHLPQLFEMFSSHAARSGGLCLPLAVAMFGNWLLDYNRDPDGESNYKNGLILHYFRKAARLALAFRRVAPRFEPALAHIPAADRVAVSRFLHRDMDNALSLALSSLAAYYQYAQNHTVAVSLWELNCHLTQDAESGHLAILGLSDGFGLGNHIKERRLGKRARSNKFATKRRIAHLYRILMQLPAFDEYGASWATKEKYD